MKGSNVRNAIGAKGNVTRRQTYRSSVEESDEFEEEVGFPKAGKEKKSKQN